MDVLLKPYATPTGMEIWEPALTSIWTRGCVPDWEGEAGEAVDGDTGDTGVIVLKRTVPRRMRNELVCSL